MVLLRERLLDRRILMTAEVREWLHELRAMDRPTLVLISAALEELRAVGPTLGRPLVDRVEGCSIKNPKELRPGSAGSSEIRILFVFDPFRNAVLLVAGDKSGRWKAWYEEAIAVAERRYATYLKLVEEK